MDAADIDETPRDGEAPDAYAQRLAREKALAVAARHRGRTVLAADTVVVLDGRIFGKPADRAGAAHMLELLSGRDHEVLTAVAVARGGAVEEHIESTWVRFTHMTPDEVAWYVASGEADDKAGAYGIQGLASRFVERIDGSYTNVVGLPVAAVYRMLK